MPTRRERTGFRFSIAYGTGDDEVRVVEGRTERVREGIVELSTFVNGTRSLGCGVTRDSAGKGKLFEESFHPASVTGYSRVEFAIRLFEIGVRNDGRPTMIWTCNEDHVQTALGRVHGRV